MKVFDLRNRSIQTLSLSLFLSRSWRTGSTWRWCWTGCSSGFSRWRWWWGRRGSSCRPRPCTTTGTRQITRCLRLVWTSSTVAASLEPGLSAAGCQLSTELCVSLEGTAMMPWCHVPLYIIYTPVPLYVNTVTFSQFCSVCGVWHHSLQCALQLKVNKIKTVKHNASQPFDILYQNILII